jgi:uncharacterized protein
MSEHTGQPKEQCARSAVTASGSDGLPHVDIVTSVIQYDVRAGAEAHYETWLKNITSIAQRFPGHMGVNIIRPHEGGRR